MRQKQQTMQSRKPTPKSHNQRNSSSLLLNHHKLKPNSNQPIQKITSKLIQRLLKEENSQKLNLAKAWRLRLSQQSKASSLKLKVLLKMPPNLRLPRKANCNRQLKPNHSQQRLINPKHRLKLSRLCLFPRQARPRGPLRDPQITFICQMMLFWAKRWKIWRNFCWAKLTKLSKDKIC